MVQAFDFSVQFRWEFNNVLTVFIVKLLCWMGFIAVAANPDNIPLVYGNAPDMDPMVIRYASSFPCFVKVFVICMGKHLT